LISAALPHHSCRLTCGCCFSFAPEKCSREHLLICGKGDENHRPYVIMPLYEEKLINPLAVRFSQDRIWPDFQDGKRIEDSLTQIATVALEGAPYDLVLRPPFPPMEIIRLRQERREADGERLRDEKGKRLYGEESWFTFDNRRLYCLQRAALQMSPMVVGVVVKVLYDFPEVRCARHKFRTTSDGCSVKISLPDGQPGSLWNWHEAARAGEGVALIIDAVRRDTTKNKKEMLADVPPMKLLSPGTRETTVAERFNLGAIRGTDSANGKAAGQQLLSLLQGGSANAESVTGGSTAGGLAALFGQATASPVNEAPETQSWDGYSKGRGKGRGKGSATAEDEGGKSRRRRRPKGGGKGDGKDC